jgi:ribosomal protein S18 acetylase RimI-like enzyme
VEFLRPEASEINEVAEFMARMNRAPEHQIGFCEDRAEQIARDFADFGRPVVEAMIVGRTKGALAAAFAFDCDPDVRRAWLYGPFVEDGDWNGTADEMWARLEPLLPGFVGELELFFNIENRRCEAFGTRYGFTRRKPDATVLRLDRRRAPEPAAAEEFTDSFRDQLVDLHDRLFPNTYLPGAQLVRGLAADKRALIVTEDGRLLGYIYGAVQADVGHAGIDYLGVVSDRRGEGHAERLIRAACAWMFTDERVEEISLTVDAGNEAARALYAKVGFDWLFDGRAMRRPRSL